MAKGRAQELFEGLMKSTNKISDGAYIATTSKRKSLVIPEGYRVYDEDEKKWYVGDGATVGGTSPETRLNIRRIKVEVSGASGMTWTSGVTSSNFNYFTYAGASSWRTGDKIILHSGASLPGGYLENQAYYVYKPSGNPDATTFQLCSGRATCFSGQPHSGGGNVSGPSIVSGIPSGGGYSGAQFFMFTNHEFGVWPEDDIVILDKVSGERQVGIILPNIQENDGFSVTIKKPFCGAADSDVYISGQNTNRIVATGEGIIDGTNNIVLNRHFNDYITVVANAEADSYFAIAKSVSGAQSTYGY